MCMIVAVVVGGPAVGAYADDAEPESDSELTVPDQNITVEGGTITVDSPDTASINVDTIPENWSVEDVSDEGDFFESTGELNWDFGERANRSVNATIVPGPEAEVGDTIDLTALNDQGETDTFTVSLVEAPVELNLTANDTSVTVGDSVSFSVSNDDTGEPVENATITAIQTGEDTPAESNTSEVTLITDTDGNATHTFEQPGTIAVTASKSSSAENRSFTDDSLELVVEPDTHESGTDREVANAVGGLTEDGDEAAGESEVTGGDVTVLRGNLIDGETQIDDVEVSGADYTRLRGWLLDQ